MRFVGTATTAFVLIAGATGDGVSDGASVYDQAMKEVSSQNVAMTLVMMPEQGMSGRGAVCLDGSDAGFYIAKAADAAHANDWQLYFEGGAWCYDPVDCWGRSSTMLGSSKNWPQTADAGGIMSDDCQVNPDFCNYNRVYMKYCDGNSFSGDRDEPLSVREKPLYFRGRRILDAVLETLQQKYHLGDAKTVMLTGCSAGGLATILQADYVHESLVKMGAPLTKYKSVPISGFFLDHATRDNKIVYGAEIKEIFLLANSTFALNQECVHFFRDTPWLCNFARYSYNFTQTPIFPINSASDSWQTKCIYAGSLVPGFPDNQTTTENGRCGSGQCLEDVDTCSQPEVALANKYIMDFNSDMSSVQTFTRHGNGAFIHSCQTHCEAQDSSAWHQFEVDGVSIQKAVSKWWNSEAEPASSHTYQACLFSEQTSPHQCNPTCKHQAPAASSIVV